ncbi:hypothetical protein EDF22_0660 [Rathayibacter sp. PhB127]|uniref:hypothetical protein n=1 Tax=Rathayibacter sp. PhB127 TaxID=2485176 RepID=UPI000F4C4683|nr:hypothetical protein [Rathayibacter sp. PhB127]ROS28928.1 hypothetical protein EDF22_0660 [Rathayibacter sp. PhB127]
MRDFLHALRSRTIWAPGAIPEHEKKWATPLRRFAFPFYDLVAVVTSIIGIIVGIPAIETLAPDWFADSVAGMFAVAALSALLGAVFPKLCRLELWGKRVIFSILGMYFFALMTLAHTAAGTRYFVAGIVLFAMVLPTVALWILGIEIRDRRLKDEKSGGADA